MHCIEQHRAINWIGCHERQKTIGRTDCFVIDSIDAKYLFIIIAIILNYRFLWYQICCYLKEDFVTFYRCYQTNALDVMHHSIHCDFLRPVFECSRRKGSNRQKPFTKRHQKIFGKRRQQQPGINCVQWWRKLHHRHRRHHRCLHFTMASHAYKIYIDLILFN